MLIPMHFFEDFQKINDAVLGSLKSTCSSKSYPMGRSLITERGWISQVRRDHFKDKTASLNKGWEEKPEDKAKSINKWNT